MNITRFLFGIQFLHLIQEGKQVDRLIKNGGIDLLKISTAEQENTINIQWYRHSIPSPLSVGIIIMLLEIVLAWGWATLIFYFKLPVELSVILLFSITPLMCAFAILIPYRIGRGYASGLQLICYFYVFNIILTSIVFFLTLIKAVEFNEWMRQFYFLPLQLLVIYSCRYTINSKSFYKIISFFRTTRLLVETKKEREKQEKYIK